MEMKNRAKGEGIMDLHLPDGQKQNSELTVNAVVALYLLDVLAINLKDDTVISECCVYMLLPLPSVGQKTT